MKQSTTRHFPAGTQKYACVVDRVIQSRFMRKRVLPVLLVLLSGASAARAGSPSQQQAADYVPPFFEQAVQSAEQNEAGASAALLADRESAQKAFDAAMQNIRADAVASAKRTPEEILRAYLPHDVLVELDAVRTAGPAGINKYLSQGAGLNKLLAAAVAYSPAIKAAEREFNAAMNRYGQAEYLNQLVYQYLGFTQSLDIIATPQANERMVQMSWPMPGSATLQGEAVNIDVETARVNFEAAVRDVMADVRLAYADLLFFDAMAGIVRENTGVARKIENIVTTMYGTGAGMYQDMVKISIRIDNLKAQEQSFLQKRRVAASKLLEAVGLPRDIALTSVPAVDYAPVLGRDKLRDAARTRQQGVRVMELMVRRMDVMVDMGSRMAFPDYSLGFSYFQNIVLEPMAGQGEMPSFAVRPMGPGAAPTFAGENAYVQEMRDARDAAAQQLEDMRNRMAAEVDQSYAAYQAASNTAQTYHKSVIPKTYNAYEAGLASYMAGAGGFMDLLDDIEMILDQKMAYQDALLDSRMAAVMMETAAGGGVYATKGGTAR